MSDLLDLRSGDGIAFAADTTNNKLYIQIDINDFIDKFINNTNSVLYTKINDILSARLKDYVLTTTLNSTLNNYVTASTLESTLDDYVANTEFADKVSNDTQIKNMCSRIAAVENGVTPGSEFSATNFRSSGSGVTATGDGSTRAWVEAVVLDTSAGLIDFGDNAASSGANSNAKIYIEY